MRRIKFERLRREWPQARVGQLVQLIGGHERALHQHEISEIEAGRRVPTERELQALGRVFQVTPPSVLLKQVAVRDPEEQTV